MNSPTPEQIRAAREAAGLTQAAAATLIQCSRRAWVKWERGERQIHPAMWELFLIKTL
jgi:putative transcriptional regulator